MTKKKTKPAVFPIDPEVDRLVHRGNAIRRAKILVSDLLTRLIDEVQENYPEDGVEALITALESKRQGLISIREAKVQQERAVARKASKL